MAGTVLRLNDGFQNTSPELIDEVKILQNLLKKDGFNIEADGLFGRDTEEAVKRFQREHNLDDDGIVGALTWAALKNEPAPDTSKLIQTTFAGNNQSLIKQLNEANKYKDFIAASSSKYGIQQCVVLGLGSRESQWGLALSPVGPAGTGDTIKRRFPTQYRTAALPPDGGFGRGLMQVDFDAHEFARTSNWKDPGANIDYGCSVLSGSVSFMKRKTDLKETELVRAGIAGYNCGPGNVLKTVQNGLDVDYYTFGRNYSKDVLNRAGWFQLNGWE